MGVWLGLLASVGLADPVVVQPRWQVSFPAAANGKAAQSTAVPLDGDSLLVAVVSVGADPMNPKLQLGSRPVTSKVIGHDPISRLQFFEVDGGSASTAFPWVSEAGGHASAPLEALSPAGLIKCRSNGWVKQVGGKILPLALLRVTFEKSVPAPGTPLISEDGKVVGILFQASGNGNIGYVIPAEAVHRVRRDIRNGGRLVRGWLGLALRAETESAKVVRVLPGSPAAQKGILAGDVITRIGTRQITDYADAANAFFYLIPGEPVKVSLLRGVEALEITLLPTKPAAN